MKGYIQGIGIISPQDIFASSAKWQLKERNGESKLACIEPDYESWLDVKSLRRMSRILKMGSVSALQALIEAGIDNPEAIITGTAYGCLEDTGAFLRKMIENNEQMLNPTPFIQSTHNAIGSQVALLLKCHGYNQTFSQRAFSFEHALLDGLMLLEEKESDTVLVGAVDEITDDSYAILKRLGMGRREYKLGEGAAYFTLSKEFGDNRYGSVCGVKTIYKPTGIEEIKQQLDELLAENGITLDKIDYILSGSSGNDSFTTSGIFDDGRVIYFKKYCGEYPTASSFACALGATILRHQSLPEGLVSSSAKEQRPVEWVLVYNTYFGTQYGMILLKRD